MKPATTPATRARRTAASDRGAFSTEYAIAIGLAAALVLIVMIAYRTRVEAVLDSWGF
ncbi:hypothetical protein ACFQY4_18060 [Catellatospora bangladeshensis]|uniref:Uncharacterized protein n=1 Tax=Catellatospora bangladeshensis TaxID=310355 RepID=A0A8J3JK10_9ACTN|nr:hypothetical protein [Catellatospora bangladeshensis]GIF82081.1 hypothetical protein Cba03nite_34300 [Catellatospora bangladeshensis]